MSLELVSKSITVYFRPKDKTVGFNTELLSKLDKLGYLHYKSGGWFYYCYSVTAYDAEINGVDLSIDKKDKIKSKIIECCGSLELEFEEDLYGFQEEDSSMESCVLSAEEIRRIIEG